jgi:hypothetical protein
LAYLDKAGSQIQDGKSMFLAKYYLLRSGIVYYTYTSGVYDTIAALISNNIVLRWLEWIHHCTLCYTPIYN